MTTPQETPSGKKDLTAKPALAEWSDQDKKQLKDLWDQGLTARAISLQIGRTKNSVIGQVHRIGLQARPSPIKKPNPSTVASGTSEGDGFKSPRSSGKKETPKTALGRKAPYGKVEMKDLWSTSCRYPTVNPGGKRHHLYCGRTTQQGKPYCQEHNDMCFVGSPPRKK